MPPDTNDLTALVAAAGHGDRAAWDRLVPMVYAELKRLAAAQMRRERDGNTIQPTALVHEAFIRLFGQYQSEWNNREHFFGAAARVMRRVLVDFARNRRAVKRDGGARVGLESDGATRAVLEFDDRTADVLAVDDALRKLAEFSPDQARIVELRFFGGLSVEQAARVMGVSPATIDRGWRIARAFLLRELSAAEQSD